MALISESAWTSVVVLVSLTLCEVFILLPAFLIGAGGVLFYDGLQIYEHYESREGSDNDLVVILLDTYQTIHSRVDIYNEDKFVPIEFSGVLASVLFYVSHPAFVPQKRILVPKPACT